MAWTTTLPNQPGIYWLKLIDGSTQMVTVKAMPFAGCATVQPALVISELSNLTGQEQWQGPITPPT